MAQLFKWFIKETIINILLESEDEEDFVVDNEWTWNESDIVSIIIDPSKIKLRLKGDIKKYEI